MTAHRRRDDDPPGPVGVQELLERVLEECLGDATADQEAALDRVCVAHPEHETVLRKRFASLARRGLLESGSSQLAPAQSLEHVGEFRILETLGRGGMGVVYLAEQPSMSRRVALKLVRSELLHQSTTRRRFRREVEAVSGLDHPGICTIYEAGEIDGNPYIAMRYIEGETLAQRLRQLRHSGNDSPTGDSSMPTAERAVFHTLGIIENAARALHVAHEAGLIHRDIKPGNIMVTPDEEPVLLDFGLARLVEGDTDDLTMTGDQPGTPAYMSPEQIETRSRPLDRRTDVYSLGVTLFEALTLRLPFVASTREELYRQILTAAPPDASRHNRALSTDVRTVLATAMERDPDARYETVLEFARDLRRIHNLEPIAARRPSVLERTWRWMRREPLRAVLAAVLIVGVPTLAYVAGSLIAAQPAIEAGEAVLADERIEHTLAVAFEELLEGLPRRAIRDFDEVLSTRPDSPIALCGRALAFKRQGQPKRALATLDGHDDPNLEPVRRYLTAAIGAPHEAPRSGSTPIAFFFSGLFALARGENGNAPSFDVAYQRIHECILRTKRVRRVFLSELAHAAGHTSDKQRVTSAVDALLSRWPNSPASLLVAGKALETAAPDRSLELLGRVCDHPDATKPQRSRARFLLTLRRIGRGTVRSGDPEFEELIAAKGNSLVETWRLARTLMVAGEWQRARKPLEQYLERAPGKPQINAWLGDVLRREGKLDDAIRYYRIAIENNRSFTDAYVSLGLTLNELGRAKEALRKLDTAIDLDANHAEAHQVRGVSQTLLGDLDSAKLSFKRSLSLDTAALASPTLDGYSARMLGNRFRKLGRDEEAVAAYRHACRLLPDNAGTHSDLALMLSRLRRPCEALEPLLHWVLLDPKNTMARDDLGCSALDAGDAKTALEAWSHLKERKPDDPRVLLHLARALRDSGRAEEALPLAERAHELGRQQPGWQQQYSSGQLLRFIRVHAEYEERGVAIVSGEVKPKDAEDAWAAADLAYRRGEYPRSIELFERAFAWRPAFEPGSTNPLFSPAAAAALRLADETADPAAARAQRDRALGWMNAEVTRFREADDRHAKTAAGRLWKLEQSWPMRSVRDPKLVERLADAERATWQEFWSGVRAGIEQLEAKR